MKEGRIKVKERHECQPGCGLAVSRYTSLLTYFSIVPLTHEEAKCIRLTAELLECQLCEEPLPPYF